MTIVLAVGVAAFLAGRMAARDDDPSPQADPARASAAPAVDEIPADYGGPVAADITGRTLDRSGIPVVGAEVIATPSELIFAESGEREDRILEQITPANTLKAKSDSHGRFRLSGTRAALRYDVHPAPTLRVFKAADGCDPYGVLPGGNVAFVTPSLGRVRLDVLMPDGRPAPTAVVDFSWSGPDGRELWTPEAPVLSVVPGTVDISVAYKTFRAQLKNFVVVEGGDVRAEVRLVPHGTLRVRVTCPPGLDPESISVHATEDDALAPFLGWSRRGEFSAGAFTIEGLAFGRWRVGASHPSGREVAREEVEVAADVCEIALDLPPEDKRDFVIVRVLDSTGAPVGDATVEGYFRGWCRSAHGSGRPIGVGVFRVRHPYSTNPSRPGSRYTASVSSPTFGSREVEYAGGVDEEIVIRFPAVAAVTIRVPGKDSSSSVHIAAELPGDPWTGAQASVVEGRANFPHVPHGTAIVYADDFPGTAMRITVPCAGEVEYRGEPLRAWRVEDVEADGRAAAAGLRAGDLIIGIGKTEFRDGRHREALWAAASLEDRPVAIVLRGTLRESIPLDPAAITPARIAGADLLPALR